MDPEDVPGKNSLLKLKINRKFLRGMTINLEDYYLLAKNLSFIIQTTLADASTYGQNIMQVGNARTQIVPVTHILHLEELYVICLIYYHCCWFNYYCLTLKFNSLVGTSRIIFFIAAANLHWLFSASNVVELQAPHMPLFQWDKSLPKQPKS